MGATKPFQNSLLARCDYLSAGYLELRTAMVTVTVIGALVPFVLCVLLLYENREALTVRKHEYGALIGAKNKFDQNGIIRQHCNNKVSHPENIAKSMTNNNTLTKEIRENPVSVLDKCQEMQKYTSIKHDPVWNITLKNRFNALVDNLRTAVDKQYTRTAQGWRESLHRERILLAAAFKPLVTCDEFATMISTFYTLADRLTMDSITFFLYGGSALGAYRHFGVIPWDDDIDIMISVKDINRTRDALSTIPGYILASPKNIQWKFYLAGLDKYRHIPHSWPFIDIFFYEENATHIWDRIPAYKNSFVYPKYWIFPLLYRPFEGGFVPVPCGLKTVLNKNYATYTCQTSYYFHKYEVMRDSYSQADVHCSLIHQMFPFTFREPPKDSTNCVTETLKTGESVLNKYSLPRFCDE